MAKYYVCKIAYYNDISKKKYKGLHYPVGSNQPNWKENGIHH